MSASDRPQAVEIVTRLRQTRADMIGTDDEPHYFDCHEAAAEIERLRRWKTLTDAEREAILYCVSCAQDSRDTLAGSDARATQMIQTAMRLAIQNVGPAPVEGPRLASVTDVGGAGPTLTDAERFVLREVRDICADVDDIASNERAAVIDWLLERTK